jgi:RsmE family RNA methyltransferase
MKRLWAPLAMLGVGRVAIINAAKVERNYFDTHWLSPEQFEPLLIEGLEQAGDTRLPTVSIHRRFRPFIEDLVPVQFAEHLKVVAHPAGGDAAGVIRDNGRRVLLAVGPEGGWTAFELDALGAAGFRALSLGRRTLRTDVACIGLLAVLDAALQMNMEDSQQ